MKKTVYLFLLIIILGAFIRLYDLNWETFGDGEIEVYQAASEFLKGNFLENFYIFNEAPLGKYLFTIFSLIKPVEFGMRLVSVIFGIATIISVFYLTKKLYNDEWVSLLASLFTALSLIHIQFSRYVQLESMLAFFFVAILYAFLMFNEKRSNKNAALLGITAALGILTKFIFIYAIIAIIIFFIIKKMIDIKRKPNFSITIDNYIIKAFFVFIITFSIIWPNALYPLNTHISLYVENSFGTHEIDMGIPTIILALGHRFTQMGTAATENILLNIPVIGHSFLFFVKESFVFILFLIMGIITLFKYHDKNDIYIIIFIAIFFSMLWLQEVRYTYRYITIIIPFFAIVAAKSIYLIKRYLKPWIITSLALIGMLTFALMAHPNYALFYNEMQPIVNIPEYEGKFSEGIRDVVAGIGNCSAVLTSEAYVFKLDYHYEGLASSNYTEADCVVSDGNDEKTIEYIENNNCKLTNTVIKKGQKLFDIYRC